MGRRWSLKEKVILISNWNTPSVFWNMIFKNSMRMENSRVPKRINTCKLTGYYKLHKTWHMIWLLWRYVDGEVKSNMKQKREGEEKKNENSKIQPEYRARRKRRPIIPRNFLILSFSPKRLYYALFSLFLF